MDVSVSSGKIAVSLQLTKVKKRSLNNSQRPCLIEFSNKWEPESRLFTFQDSISHPLLFFLLSYLINETPCFLGHVLLLRNCQHTQLTISYPYTPSTSSWAKLWACWAALSLSSSAEKVESCVFFYEMPSPKRIHLGSESDDFSTSEASFIFLGFLITYIVLFYRVSISQLYCKLLFGCLFLFLSAIIGFNWRPINCMEWNPIAIFASHKLGIHKSII